MYKSKLLSIVIMLSFLISGSSVHAGLLGSLDNELTSLIKNTEPYLVTVKGDESWRNLIATGIVYSEDGYVITSSPAFDASDFDVTFANGESYQAEPVGVDHETGLAVLKIKGKRKFTVPEWGSPQSLKNGDWVLFVGNSYDKPSSVNIGTYDGNDEDGFLQLNLNVNPGSSGGAVLNTDGEVVGILVAMEYSQGPSKLWKNLNFGQYYLYDLADKSEESALALPIDQAKEVAEQLIKNGEIKRGYLGISQKDLTDREKEENRIDGGVVIIGVADNSPADEAGLRKDDIITEIDGDKIDGTGDLYHAVRSHKPGDKITVTYLRDGKTGTAVADLGESERDYFLGSMDYSKILPKLKVNNKLKIPNNVDLEEELEQLKNELNQLRSEFEDLKAGTKK